MTQIFVIIRICGDTGKDGCADPGMVEVAETGADGGADTRID